MLSEAPHWKTYRPTANFESADKTQYRGRKTFEQPVVATEAGKQTLPGLAFSYFDPNSRRYETLHTEPLTIEVAPAAATAMNDRADRAALAASSVPAKGSPRTEWRPDHAPAPSFAPSLVPLYFQPAFLALPSLMALAFPGVWLWLRRRERRATDGAGAASTEPGRLVVDLERASAAGDVGRFFAAARAMLQRALGARWQVPPETVTRAEVAARLGPDHDLEELFALADEALYSGRGFGKSELETWKRVVLRYLNQEAA
jgi:hypothetical protein